MPTRSTATEGDAGAMPVRAPGQKSVVVAYLLYFTMWWCGAHHWYLERDGQAFLWMVSFGGFGIGALTDFFYLYSYVQEANAADRGPRGPGLGAMVLYWIYCSWFGTMFSFFGGVGSVVLSRLAALPALTFGRRQLQPQVPGVFAAVALGLLLIGNSEEMEPWTLCVCAVTAVLSSWQGSMPDGEPTVGRRSGTQRLAAIATILAGITAWTIVTEVDSMDGGRTTVAEQLFAAGEWLQNVYANFNKMEWEDAFRAASTGEKGTRQLLRVLELEPPTTWKDIKHQYRKLSRVHHPDRGGDAQKMGEINKAYEALKDIYALKGTQTDYDFDDGDTAAHGPGAAREGHAPRFRRTKRREGGGTTFEFKFG